MAQKTFQKRVFTDDFSMETQTVYHQDGRSHFTPFLEGTGNRYKDLYSSPCGVLQSTKKMLRVKISLKKKLSRELLLEQLDRDYKAIRRFIKMTR